MERSERWGKGKGEGRGNRIGKILVGDMGYGRGEV